MAAPKAPSMTRQQVFASLQGRQVSSGLIASSQLALIEAQEARDAEAARQRRIRARRARQVRTWSSNAFGTR